MKTRKSWLFKSGHRVSNLQLLLAQDSNMKYILQHHSSSQSRSGYDYIMKVCSSIRDRPQTYPPSIAYFNCPPQASPVAPAHGMLHSASSSLALSTFKYSPHQHSLNPMSPPYHTIPKTRRRMAEPTAHTPDLHTHHFHNKPDIARPSCHLALPTHEMDTLAQLLNCQLACFPLSIYYSNKNMANEPLESTPHSKLSHLLPRDRRSSRCNILDR